MNQQLRPGRATAVIQLVFLGLSAGLLPAQLIPKRITEDSGTPARRDTLQGRWTGTAREDVEGVGEVSFPIAMTFSGDPGALRLEVSATVKVPAEGGQKLTVTIAATYRGALQGTDLRMRSERIETRIVELGQTVPSAPQTVEARLADGVLSGRVGNPDDGWTSFSARPVGGGEDAVRGPAGFIGAWRGTGREPGPDGRELQYPVTFRIEGRNGSFQAQLQADLRYPVDGGGTVPVQYRATFEGSVEGEELRLRSEFAEIRLVEQDRTERGPAQRAVGRIADGVLRVQVGDEQSGMSTLELRRDGAAPPQPADEVRDGRAPPLGEPGRVGGALAASPYATLVLERQDVRDPGMGGVVSHTLLVPQGWKFEGGARWTANPDSFVHFVGALRGPQQESLTFDWSRVLTFQSNSVQPSTDSSGPGQDRPDGTIVRRAPQGYGEVAVEIILPRLRPGATDAQLVEATRLPDVEEKFRAANAMQLQMLEQLLQGARESGGSQIQTDASMFLVAERALVRYRLDGQQWDEEIRSTQFGTRYLMRSEIMTAENGMWQISEVVCSRAPTGRLEACLPVLLTIAGSLQETPRWSTAVAEIRAGIAEARTRGLRTGLEEQRRRGELIAKTQSEISDIQMQTWRSRQDSIDRMHKATIDSIRGTHDFRAADGTTHAVTNQFDRAFMDQGGRMILTSDPNFQAGVDWQEMKRVDPFDRSGGR